MRSARLALVCCRAPFEGGRGPAVIQRRMEFRELKRGRFNEGIACATDRRVIGFMSGNQQNRDMMCEVFILAPVGPRASLAG